MPAQLRALYVLWWIEDHWNHIAAACVLLLAVALVRHLSAHSVLF